MKHILVRRGWIVVLVLVGAATLTVIPAAQGQVACSLDPALQPQEPLEADTVGVKSLVKTIAMEKEVFLCETAGPPAIADLETFIELVGVVSDQGVALHPPVVEAARCLKQLDGGVRCDAVDVEIAEIPADGVLGGCAREQELLQPRDPVEMNSLIAGRAAYTAKVEKEVFRCGDLIADLYLFTLIVEAPTPGAAPTFRPVSKDFVGVICFKDEASASLDRCGWFKP